MKAKFQLRDPMLGINTKTYHDGLVIKYLWSYYFKLVERSVIDQRMTHDGYINKRMGGLIRKIEKAIHEG